MPGRGRQARRRSVAETTVRRLRPGAISVVVVASALAGVLAGGCGEAGRGTSPAGGSTSGAGGQAFGRVVTLPSPTTAGGMPLDQAIAERRSQRTFGAGDLPLATIGQLLWAGQGVTAADGKRAAPSAGGLYPLELYVVTATQVMHYLPAGHRVAVRDQAGVGRLLQAAAHGQQVVGDAPDVIVIAAVPGRLRQRYGGQADRFVDLEAGHVAENVLLQATASQLAAVPVGSIDQAGAAAAVGLPAGETVVYLVPVGPRP